MSEKLLQEDSTVQQDKWATGMSVRSAGPHPMNLLDIIKKNEKFRGQNGKAPES